MNTFPAFHININSSNEKDILPLVSKGLTKLRLGFKADVSVDTVLLMFAEFPGLMEIDGARNVSI